jgi:preprotein translocase subunit SecE
MEIITRGHIYFAIVFIIVFAIILVFVYLKDLKTHRKNFKNSWKVILLVAVLFVLFLFFKNWLIQL